jgi:hypothetical protein
MSRRTVPQAGAVPFRKQEDAVPQAGAVPFRKQEDAVPQAGAHRSGIAQNTDEHWRKS